jgi:two-component system, OmpR family, phosphate regulon sensor histidine kinase PhoR
VDLSVWVLVLGAGALCLAVWQWRAERRRREAAERQALHWEAEVGRIAEDKDRIGLRYDLLADSSADLLLITDRDLRLTYANAAAESVFGQWETGVSLIRYTQSLALEEEARQALASGEVDSERLLSLRDRPFRCRVRVRGDIVGLALTDAAEVQRLTRARQDMVANLSHELRTPLTSIGLLAQTLVTRPGDSATTAELANKILAEVDTLNQMSQEMLDLAAIESGRQVIRLVSVPLREIVAVPVERLREQAARQGITLLDEIPSKLSVLADRDQAARGILNVLHNAVKFTPVGGSVSLTAAADPDGEHVVLLVSDEGPGIAPADLARIFERFYRGDQARGTPGTGLGLAITRHILQAHGGDAWAENRTPPANGAVVHLRFLTG